VPYNNGCLVRPELRLAIYLRDNMSCLYCDRNLTEEREQLSLDHLKPQSSRTGTDNRPCNLVTACRRCNSSRGRKRWRHFATEQAIARIVKHRRRSVRRLRTIAKLAYEEAKENQTVSSSSIRCTPPHHPSLREGGGVVVMASDADHTLIKGE
jgi:hypothetical protein